jgi:hypothetical protein
MIADLLETVAGIAEGILSGLEGRGPAATFQGPSVYEFIDDLVRTYPRSGVQRVDGHTLGLRDAVLVFEVIDEGPEHVTGTSLEELEQRGIHVVVSRPPDTTLISFHGTSDDGGTLEGRIVPARGWAFLIASTSEDAPAELAQMVDERLGALDRTSG